MTTLSPLASALATPDCPVELAALMIEKDFRPRLEVEEGLRTLDELGATLSEALRGVAHADVDTTITSWFRGEGFKGEREAYYAPRNSYLSQVLELRRGMPITLSVVLIAATRRAAVPVVGVGFPGHFIVRRGERFFDPFDAGNHLTMDDLERFTQRMYGEGVQVHPAWLEPVDTRSIAIRMLTNLQRCHARRGAHAEVLLASDRLVDLTGKLEHRRDRGIAAFELGAFGAAAEDLRAYVEGKPGARDAAKMQTLLAKAETAQQTLS